MGQLDADALEREGWSLCRTFQKDKDTMVYEVKKPSDFPTIEERKTGKWEMLQIPISPPVYKCSVCDSHALPSAKPEQRWIPCSERLPDHPENNDYYLVTIQCEHHDGWDDYVTGFAEWTKHGWDELSCYIGQIKVIAWMPLPEPYKERREDG